MDNKVAITSVAVVALILVFTVWAYSGYENPVTKPTEDTTDAAPTALDAVYIDIYSDRCEIRVITDETDFNECLLIRVHSKSVITHGTYTYLGEHVYMEVMSPLPVVYMDWVYSCYCYVWDWDAYDVSAKYTCPGPIVTLH